MGYKPIQPITGGTKNTTSLMAKSGVNLRDLPQLLDPTSAQVIENYVITAEGGLEKRGGLDLLFDTSVTSAITALEKWDDDTYIFGYDSTKVAAYTKSTATVTDIKTDFNTNVTSLARYSNGYMFVASPQDKIGRISRTLDYDAETGAFTAGLVLTGGTSGATAIILEVDDAGTTGTLTLGDIVGTFEDDETITDTSTGSADANGVVGFTYTEISTAPIARHIAAINARLFASLEDEDGAIRYSEIDDGSNPPYDGWSEGTTSTQGGSIYYRNAGKVNVITNLGNVIIVGADEGKWAFTIDTIDSAGTLKKVDNTVMYRLDGGMKAALQTDEGVFYVNAEGLWQLVSIGQSNVKFSDQEVKVSNQLGNDFFEDATFTNATFIKDDKTNNLLLSYAEDSNINNQVLVYNTDLKAFSIFTGWNINVFMNDEGILYGAGASTAKVWEILKTDDDDGTDIYYKFEQELNVGGLETIKEIVGQYIQGELSPDTEPLLQFSIYDRTGAYVNNKLELQWNYETTSVDLEGYGEMGWGGAWGGEGSASGTVVNFAGFRGRIKNFQRIIMKISGNDKAPHKINWFSIQTKEKMPIRRRNLQQI